MEKQYARYKAEVKHLDEKKSSVSVLMSDNSKDRMDEVIMQSGWQLDNYMKHPILLSSHDYYSLRSQIGKAESIKVTESGLEAKFKYFTGKGNDEADWGFRLVKEGIAAYSVGFKPTKMVFGDDLEADEDITDEIKSTDPRVVYKEQELLENSQVVVPCNQNALMNSYESVDKFTKGLIKKTIDTGLIDLNDANKKILELIEKLSDKDETIKGFISEIRDYENKRIDSIEEKLEDIENLILIQFELKEKDNEIVVADGRKSKDADFVKSIYGSIDKLTNTIESISQK
jgi:hypothetical protein